MIRKTATILNVQMKVGFIKTHENGIIEQAIEQSVLSTLLKSYARTADFQLTFGLGYREILHTFIINNDIDVDGIIIALSNAYDSQYYNIQTILSTMNLEYDPISNININEQIVTTTTISANQTLGKVSISKQIDEINKSISDTMESGKQKESHGETITDKKGSYTETTNNTENLGKVENAIHELTTIGAQENTNENILTHAPYNTSTYSPKDKTNITENKGEQINDTNTTNETNPVENTASETKNITEHTDDITRDTTIEKDGYTDTKNSNIIQKPYSENTSTDTRTNTDNSKNDENKERQLKGIQGKSPQELLLLQRQLANIDIVKWLCEITINTIGSGFIIAW